MTNKLEQFLEKQINHGNIDWESKSKLIRASGEKISGHTNKILKKFENKFNFGLSIDQKNETLHNGLKMGSYLRIHFFLHTNS